MRKEIRLAAWRSAVALKIIAAVLGFEERTEWDLTSSGEYTAAITVKVTRA